MATPSKGPESGGNPPDAKALLAKDDKVQMPSLETLADVTGTPLTAAQSEAVKDAQPQPKKSTPNVRGYLVNHEFVGPWKRGRKVTPDEMVTEVGYDENTEKHIQRLIDRGSVTPLES